MSQEHKELLLKDLCSRLPYGVKLQNVNDIESIVELRSIDLDNYCCEILFYTYRGKALTICEKSKLFRFGKILRYKPYLFPLSSITEEQKNAAPFELSLLNAFINGYISLFEDEELTIEDLNRLYNWFNRNHLDYRGLIPMGLAIDATGLNIY